MGESPVAVQFKIPKPRDYNSVPRAFNQWEHELTSFFSMRRAELQKLAIINSLQTVRSSKEWRRKSQLSLGTDSRLSPLQIFSISFFVELRLILFQICRQLNLRHLQSLQLTIQGGQIHALEFGPAAQGISVCFLGRRKGGKLCSRWLRTRLPHLPI